MGIQCWFSRFVLPGSSALLEPLVPLNADPSDRLTLSSDVQTKASLPVTESLNTPKIDRSSHNFQATTFKLIVMALSETRLVVLDLPIKQSFNVVYRQLLKSIMFALKWPVLPEQDWVVNEFNWPLSGFKSKSYQTQDALFAVQGFLKHRCSLEKYQQILLFGPMSAQYVCEVESASNYGVFTQSDIQYAYSYSLDQLVQIPQCKAEAWSHLSSLID